MRFAYPAYKIAACRPDKTRQRRIRRWMPDALCLSGLQNRNA